MAIFRNILFPVDFSDRCAETARPVAALARQFDSKVTLIHAIGDFAGLNTPDAPSPDEWVGWLRKTSEKRLRLFGTPCLDGLVVERCIEDGDPASVITTYASAHGIDLIAMPTHGRGLFRRLLLGSVTNKVLHDCAVPVWTTAHATAPGLQPERIQNIVCAIDLSEASHHVVQTAGRIAQECGASLYLVNAIPMPIMLGTGGVENCSPETVQAIQDGARMGLEKMSKEAGVPVKLHAEPGFVVPVVSAMIGRQHADLLVIGRGHLHETLGSWRTDVNLLIRESSCPVVSV